jgi:hypothetical protein
MIRDGKRSACPTKFVLRAKSRIVGRALRLPVPGGTSWARSVAKSCTQGRFRTVKWLLDILRGLSRLLAYLAVKSFSHPRYQRNQRLNSVT